MGLGGFLWLLVKVKFCGCRFGLIFVVVGMGEFLWLWNWVNFCGSWFG